MSKGARDGPTTATVLQRLYRLRFFDFLTALFASAARIVTPEFEHCLAKMVNDICTIEVDVFHQRSAIFTVENDVLLFTRRAAPLYDHADRIRRALGECGTFGGMKNVSPSRTM